MKGFHVADGGHFSSASLEGERQPMESALPGVTEIPHYSLEQVNRMVVVWQAAPLDPSYATV